MNRRIIKAILKKKHKELCESIKDENVRKLIEQNTIITGGSIVSMLMKEKINDFDYYFTNKETVLAVTKYYVMEFNRLHQNSSESKMIEAPYVYLEKDDQRTEDETDFDRVRIYIKSAGVISENTDESQYQYFQGRPIEEGEDWIDQVFEQNLIEADDLDGEKIDEIEKQKYRPVFLTDNAITLSNKIQIIIRFYGSPEEIHNNYDFVHCTNYWVSKTGELVLRQEALESIINKELKYVGSKYPVCSVVRMRKFIKRGWHVNAGQMVKMCFQISQLDLSDLDVLEDQLTGVDTAYFVQIIDDLRQKQLDNPDFHVEMPYLITIIDRLF